MTEKSAALLIVDDDQTIRSILSKKLSNDGYITATAEDGRQALDMATERVFDMVLLDLIMPGVDGIEVVKTLRQRHTLSELPIIIISVNDDSAKIVEALQCGANDYIHKPVDANVLGARIHTQIALKRKEQDYQEIKHQLEHLVEQRTGELKDTNVILQRDRQRFEYLLDASPAITYVTGVDTTHHFRFISNNLHWILGYQVEEMLDTGFWLNRVHPDDKPRVLKKTEQNLKQGGGQIEYRFQHSNGDYRWMLDQYQIIEENNKEIEIVGSWIDITTQKELTAAIDYKSSHDETTGLINRREFERRIRQLLSNVWSETVQHVLCYLDLDQFKIINNSHGNVAGDECLCQLSKLFKDTLSKRDLVAYLGGDEFGILLQHCTLNQAQRVLDRLQDGLAEYRFDWDEKRHVITASIGVVAIDQHMDDQTDILSVASSACYSAKDTGRGRIHMYDSADDAVVSRQQEMQWVERVNRALEEDRFLLFYQPIVPISDAVQDSHFELLIRMKNDDGELVPPGLFLPAVERYDLSGKIDRWVIQTTFSWLEAYSEYLDSNYSWGINLSGQSLADADLLQFVFEELERKQIPPHKIYFEITETAVIANMDNAAHFIETLRKKGCQFALDDFGSGLSSFSYLKNLPVDYLKIDGIFVKDLVENHIDFTMVKAIHDVGRAMGKKTIAEFVENAGIIEKLKIIGVDYAQGYGIAKPISLAQFNERQSGHNMPG